MKGFLFFIVLYVSSVATALSDNITYDDAIDSCLSDRRMTSEQTDNKYAIAAQEGTDDCNTDGKLIINRITPPLGTILKTYSNYEFIVDAAYSSQTNNGFIVNIIHDTVPYRAYNLDNQQQYRSYYEKYIWKRERIL